MSEILNDRPTDMAEEAIVPTVPLIYAAATMPLPPMPYLSSQLVEGHPDPAAIVVWQPKADALVRTGIWECTPGAAYYQQEPAEISMFAFFSGKALIRFTDGRKPLECGSGDVIYLPAGILSIFDVKETIRTFYCIYT